MSIARISSNLDADAALVIEELIERIKAGSADAEAVIAAHPDHADTLRRLLPAVQLMANLSRSEGPSSWAASETFASEFDSGTLGDFRLIREVGRGGMGIVYEAEQVSLGRRVALKVLPYAGAMDAKQIQRFKNEAKAAASLKHDHIVSVHAIGCERGVHFYAMEFIDGQTLAQFIHGLRPEDRRAVAGDATQDYQPAPAESPTRPVAALSTENGSRRDRAFYRWAAELIAQAAEALEHAHSLGIVHRDVKPGNLLVDTAGQVYVSDFGLARLGADAGLTISGDLLGTLRYMSPEQALARHGLVDHRADVYGLGCTLYELLTGRPAVEGEDKAEILKSIAWEEPTALRKHDKSIPAELETITLKCLAKDPNERYATAAELADDLRHWLGDRAIKAKPPGVRERVAKWRRRHRGFVRFAFILLVFAVTGLGLSTWLIWREKHSAELATLNAIRQAAIANAVNDFVETDLFAGFRDDGGFSERTDFTITESLENAAARAEERFRDQPLVAAGVHRAIGSAYKSIFDWESAIRHLTAAYDLNTAQLGPDHPDTLTILDALAGALFRSGQNRSEAIQFHEMVCASRLNSLGAEHTDTQRTLLSLANEYGAMGLASEQLRLIRQVRDVRLNTLGPNHLNTLTAQLSLSRASIGSVPLAESIQQLAEIRDRMTLSLGVSHPDTLNALQSLASAFQETGCFADVIRLRERIRRKWFEELGPTHRTTLESTKRLGMTYFEIGEIKSALPFLEQTLEAKTSTLGLDHPSTLISMQDLAIVYSYLGRFGESLSLMEKAIGLAQNRRVNRPEFLVLMLKHHYATALNLKGDYILAERVLLDALPERRRRHRPNCIWVAETLSTLGWTYLAQHKYVEAERVLRECVHDRTLFTRAAWREYVTKSMLGGSLIGQGEFLEAEPLLLEAHHGMKQLASKMRFQDRRDFAEGLMRLVALYERTGQMEKAGIWRKTLEVEQVANAPNKTMH